MEVGAMDPATVLMERATAEWTALMGSLSHLALEGLFGLLLLLAFAAIMTILVPPREYPVMGPPRIAGDAVTGTATATRPVIGDAVAIRARGTADRAGGARASSSADELAAYVARRRRCGPARADRPGLRRHGTPRRAGSELADRPTSLAVRRTERARIAARTALRTEHAQWSP